MNNNIDNKSSILVVAYACEPNKTSEPGVGWNFTKELSLNHDITVLTRENNREVIETEPTDAREFVYYDLPNIFKILKKKMPLGTQLYYLMWQWGAYRHIKNNLSEKKIDMVHHLTFGVSWISPPSFMLKKKFIWGPIGGGDLIPTSFMKEMSVKAMLQESLYYTLNKVSKYSIFSFLVRKDAKAIIFRTESIRDVFPKCDTKILPVISETASADLVTREKKVHNPALHAICVGRMTYWKGFIYAVKGFHAYLEQGGKGKLELLGNGPGFDEISAYVKEHGLEENIITRGFVDNDVVKSKLEEASLMLHPSFRDGGSWAIMEAMTYGLPVLCLDTSGPKDMVTDKCGLLMGLESPSQLITDIGKGLLELSNNPELYTTLSQNAQTRIANEYTWEVRGKEMQDIYKEVLNEA